MQRFVVEERVALREVEGGEAEVGGEEEEGGEDACGVEERG